MIALLHGKLARKGADSIVIDASGVGYEVFIPLSTYYKLPEEGATVTLYVKMFSREDTIELFGFLTEDEKRIFSLLLSVSGVGPRLARNILSGLPTDELLKAVASEDVERLKALPGVGKKTSERVVLELKDKVKELLIARKDKGGLIITDELLNDVVSALKNLGYKAQGAEEAARKVLKEGARELGFEHALKEALKILSPK